MARDLAGRVAALLQLVHHQPGLTRADAARQLELGTGAVTEIVARLVRAQLLAERPAAPSGARGRPTTELGPHPSGPVVLACAISHESWQVDAVQLGGAVMASVQGDHRGQSAAQVLPVLAAVIGRLRRRVPGRVRGLGISAPGTVDHGYLLDATSLGWREVDLRRIWPGSPLTVADNDATLAALAESRRGRAAQAGLALHVRIDAGLGGAVVEHGRVLSGARGMAGEFGHMPFGDLAVRCPCGALGCWGTAVDGSALARLLHHPPPADPVTYGRGVLRQAAAGQTAELLAVRSVAVELGRGLAGLANGLDPDLITVGGLAGGVLAVAEDELSAAYQAGLMGFRRSAPPPVLVSVLGDDGPLLGAAEQVWAQLWPRFHA